MKRKIAYILTTSALVMSAFLIGKTISTQKTVEPKPNAKQYLAVNDIQSIDYYVIKNKLTILTSVVKCLRKRNLSLALKKIHQ